MINISYPLSLKCIHYSRSQYQHYVIHRKKIRAGQFMNVMKSGSPLQNFSFSQVRIKIKITQQNIPEMLSLTRSKAVLVRKCGYGPFYMPQFDRLKMARVIPPYQSNPTNTAMRFAERPTILHDCRYIVTFLTHTQHCSDRVPPLHRRGKVGKLCKRKALR